MTDVRIASRQCAAMNLVFYGPAAGKFESTYKSVPVISHVHAQSSSDSNMLDEAFV